MNTVNRTCMTTALALLASACASSTLTLNSDRDDAVDFDRYETYAIADEAGELNMLATDGYDVGVMAAELAPDLRQMGIEALVEALEAKGLTAAPSLEEADLIVTFLVNVGAKPEVIAPDYRIDSWSGQAELGAQPVARGTLIVDMLDPRLGETDRSFLVWRGWASDTIDPEVPAEPRGAKLVSGIRKVVARYPN